MELGISTASLYPLHTEDALAELAKRGIRNVEIFANAVCELEGEILQKMISIVNEYDISVKSVHPFSSPMETLFLFGSYDRREAYILDLYKRHFDAMNKLGAKIFVLHGAILSSHCSEEHYFNQYAKLHEMGKQQGIIVAQENICYCRSSSLAFLKKMSQTLGDDVSFVIDIKQAKRSHITAFDVMDAIGDKAVHYHISDSNDVADCLPIGKGDFDFNEFLRRLEALGYNGSLIVELYRENYSDYDELAQCVCAMQKVLDKYNKFHKSI